MKLLKTVVKKAQKLTGWEIIIYKFCLLSAAWLWAIAVPVIMDGPLWLYAVLAVVFWLISLKTIITKEGNYFKDVFMCHLGKKFFQNYKTRDFVVFETSVIVIGLFIIKLFPEVLSIPLAWYTGIFGATFGYLFAKLYAAK